jgi:hypothetical protein
MPDQGGRNSILLNAVSDLMSDVSDLVRKEVRLAQAETVEAIKAKAQLALWSAVAGLLGLIALLLIIQAIVFGIASLGLALHWASLITAGFLALCAAGAFFYGKSRAAAPLVPQRAIRQVKEDVRTAREQIT